MKTLRRPHAKRAVSRMPNATRMMSLLADRNYSGSLVRAPHWLEWITAVWRKRTKLYRIATRVDLIDTSEVTWSDRKDSKEAVAQDIRPVAGQRKVIAHQPREHVRIFAVVDTVMIGVVPDVGIAELIRCGAARVRCVDFGCHATNGFRRRDRRLCS
jgi:hypothetical protein